MRAPKFVEWVRSFISWFEVEANRRLEASKWGRTLAHPPPTSLWDAPGQQDAEKAFALYQLEYKASTDRYENIYKAIWQNFSYLGATGCLSEQSIHESRCLCQTLPLCGLLVTPGLPRDRMEDAEGY